MYSSQSNLNTEILKLVNSSNINEVIKTVLNFLVVFLQKSFTSKKKHKTLTAKKKKKMCIKNI